MKLLIRKAGTKDFRKLKELKSEFYLWECKKDKRLNPAYIGSGLGARLAKNLKQKDTAFFMAEDNGNPIGYAGAEIKPNPAFIRFKKRGHMFNLYVLPEYQGKGIGKKLIDETFNWFKKNKVKDIMILVYTHNKKAHAIYNQRKFKDYIIELSNI